MFSDVKLISLEFSVNAHTMSTLLPIASEIMKRIHGVKRPASLLNLLIEYLDTTKQMCNE